ncbi:MAG: leucine-rich repeat domain-containing protein, partial [Verrucomicrobia bacterium]|nr:leucine-rich repeat domain-containing protein [Verrucomicrobiota bacterium]
HSLYLNNNRLKGLPESFGSLKLLQRLSLNNNQLERLPESFGNLQQLEWLSLTGNQLEGLPNSFGNFQQLTELYLNNNLLKSLPDTFGNLRQLQRLHLENNQMESLPSSFGNFQQLIELYLNNNLLKSLPETFGNLHLLTALYLNNNHLQSLPNTLGNLQRLSGLFLSNNQLYCLPETFRNLQQLKILSLFFNSCLFMFDKELSAFTSNYSQRPLEKYRACRDYVPSTPIARLCQLIHNQTDKDLLEPTLRSIPRSMQAKLRSRIEDIWASLAEHEQVENKDLLRANAVRAACHERVEVLNQAIIEVLKETFADFTEEQKRLVYDLVWDLAGRPEGDDNWGENHAEDNIIRLIDAVAIVLSEQGQG